jgi:integrase
MENRIVFKVKKIILAKQLNKQGEGKIYVQVVARGGNNPKRISTGIWVSPLHWSVKKQEILKGDPGFEEKNFQVDAVFSEIFNVVNDVNNPDYQPTYQKYTQLKTILQPAEVRAKAHTAVQYFEQFLKYKELELINKFSVRVYLCTLANLKDYEKSNPPITLNDLNTKEFYFNFRNFLAKKQNDNTVYKRLAIMSGFLKYLGEKEIVITKPGIHKIGMHKYATRHIALTKSELQSIIELHLEPGQQAVIDCWIFEILTGLRFHDLATLHEAEFHNDYFTKRSKKTGVTIRVALNPVTKAILEKYNNVLPVPKIAKYNRLIRSILKKNNIMTNANEMVTITKVVAGVDQQEKKLRADCCTSHTARRTFVTLALSAGNTLNSIMSSTGHTTLSSLSKYIVKNEPKFKDFI